MTSNAFSADPIASNKKTILYVGVCSNSTVCVIAAVDRCDERFVVAADRSLMC